MYAIIEAGGSQHIVRQGEWIKVNDPNLPIGEEVRFDKVKFYSDGESVEFGRPDLEDVVVTGEVAKVVKGKKIKIIKYSRRKSSQTRIGHRQKYSLVKINNISRS